MARDDNRVLVDGIERLFTETDEAVDIATATDINKRITCVIENIPHVDGIMLVKKDRSIATGMCRGEVPQLDFTAVKM